MILSHEAHRDSGAPHPTVAPRDREPRIDEHFLGELLRALHRIGEHIRLSGHAFEHDPSPGDVDVHRVEVVADVPTAHALPRRARFRFP